MAVDRASPAYPPTGPRQAGRTGRRGSPPEPKIGRGASKRLVPDDRPIGVRLGDDPAGILVEDLERASGVVEIEFPVHDFAGFRIDIDLLAERGTHRTKSAEFRKILPGIGEE